MRRKDREITDKNEIYEIIDKCTVCRIGFYDEKEKEVYIVPMNFGYTKENDEITLFFHGAKEGRKIELTQKYNSVGFEMETNYKVNSGDIACEYSARFESIIGNGEISLLEKAEDKKFALNRIMYQNTKKDNWQFNEDMIDLICILKLNVTKLTCKRHE